MDTENLFINYPCKFHLGDQPDAWQAWFNDDSWEDVFLPHDWSVHLPFSKENSSGTGYLSGGIGWYRIHIKPRKEWKEKHISITFDGVYKNSRVWCNSYYLGERPNGYISFTYDLTDFFKFDTDNVISVYVDRREIADSRWFTGSGILGKVTLNIEEPIHPDTYGVFFETPIANTDLAIWQVKTKWLNRTEQDAKLDAVFELLDANGKAVDRSETTAIIMAGESDETSVSSTLEKPKLWKPENPVLYTLKITAKVSGRSYVVFSEPVGLRSFKFDPDKGFFLNGESYVFKGVCLHHDAGVLGGAVPPAVWYQRLLKLKEMGCNAIRMSHNPHVPELYYLCDSLGFFVMDEAFDEWEGPKNKWSTGHNVYPPKHQGYYVNFNTWGKTDLKDMILRDRNHPSVIMWSIGNEIDYPNDPYCNEAFQTATGNNDANKPAEERMYNPMRPDAKRLRKLSKMLTDTAKEVDDTHPVTLAASFPELSCKVGFIDPLDVVGFNYRENLYEEHHKAYPDKPFLGSENGHGYKQWRAVTDNEYISGQFLWTGIDYLGEAKGWPIHGAMAGLLTLAGLEKTGFYRRQSFWSDKPMVHLAAVPEALSRKTVWGQEFESAAECEFSDVSENWNYEEGEKMVVKCYTNQPAVKLILNDSEIGTFNRDDSCDCIIATLDYKAGELKALALDAKGKTVAEHSLKTHARIARAMVDELSIDTKALPLFEAFDDKAPDSFRNLYRYEITLVDEGNVRVYDSDKELTISVENGRLIGVESGDLADVTPYTSATRKTYKGQLAVYVAGDKPKINVK